MHLIMFVFLFVSYLAPEVFDYVESAVNKIKKPPKQPSQEIGKPKSPKLYLTWMYRWYRCGWLKNTHVQKCSSVCLSKLDAEPAYSTLYEKDKVSYEPSREQNPSNKQEEAGYDLVTAEMDS